ncbi:alpha-E domain-containing protein [Albidovulum sediminicola]|uniref:Alpha-E domain-containing protein n=1 Tax=Albidovulum sediminicola TaxID=2984331 RepID=A0ABT2Z343_9RHOB|nr:alpha-E domain-containing protein [Defluviimonas sp. WL0075]MCV2865536.1 alpha-E domain-containing protein [Defluviimonas sp. WL0075]
MLGKTANGLFWMYRYLERAENTSRLIETGQRIALTRLGASDDEWRSILQTAGVAAGYDAAHETLTKDAAIDWMLRDPANPSSVLSSIAAARQNARMVRTALTHEVWEATNSAYMRAQELLSRKVGERDLPGVLGTIRQRAALVRGATQGTMLRNDIYDFARIGTFLERADNTARILDVKYYVLLPSASSVGSAVDNVQWETILRAVSGRGGFRMEYGAGAGPREIAQFLILDRRMPRSLAFCMGKIRDNLEYLAGAYGERSPALGRVEDIEQTFLRRDIDAVFDFGLYEFIQKQLTLLAEIGRQIEVGYRFYE